MQDNTSPEGRLLRLIRQEQRKSLEKKKKSTEYSKVSYMKKLTKLGSLLKKKWEEKFSLSRTFNITKIGEYFSLNQVNRILFLVLLILVIYLVADSLIISPTRIEKRILALQELGGEVLEIKDKAPEKKHADIVSYYTEPVKPRNIFTAGVAETKEVSPGPSFATMVSELRLQGIISGDNPQAIIENIKTRNVFFVSPGEFIGEIELKEILPGKVKLNYYGQEAELSL